MLIIKSLLLLFPSLKRGTDKLELPCFGLLGNILLHYSWDWLEVNRKKRFEQTKPESTEAELTHTNVECQSTDKYVRDIFAEQKLSHWCFSSLWIVKEAWIRFNVTMDSLVYHFTAWGNLQRGRGKICWREKALNLLQTRSSKAFLYKNILSIFVNAFARFWIWKVKLNHFCDDGAVMRMLCFNSVLISTTKYFVRLTFFWLFDWHFLSQLLILCICNQTTWKKI